MSDVNTTDSSAAATDAPAPALGLAYADAAAAGPDPADVEKNKVFAILAYLGILVLVPILAAKDSPFARYHANQGLVLLIFAVVLGWIPFVGFAVGLAALVFMILGIINAANGQLKPLPLIGGISLIK